MTLQELKEYLSYIRTGNVKLTGIEKVVDVAIESGYGAVWGAHSWKVRRGMNTSLTTTSGQAYSILPGDMEGLVSLVVLNGSRSRWINIYSEENFEIDMPQPSAHSTTIPSIGKLVYHSDNAADRWRVYWCPIPNAAYSLRVVYQRRADTAFFPNLPSYMQSAVIDECLARIMEPGDSRTNQYSVAAASLAKAITSDNAVPGSPSMLGVDPGWNDWVTVGGVANDGLPLDWPM